MYTIACRSNTPHQICNSCEISLRCSTTPTNEGRFIKCPLCREVEQVQGTRTIQSYEAELNRTYAQRHVPAAPAIRILGDRLYIHLQHGTLSTVMPPHVLHMIQSMTPHQLHLLAIDFSQRFPPAPQFQPPPTPPTPEPRIWCQSGRRTLGQCPTKSKTKRVCSFANCTQRVCLKCKQCSTH